MYRSWLYYEYYDPIQWYSPMRQMVWTYNLLKYFLYCVQNGPGCFIWMIQILTISWHNPKKITSIKVKNKTKQKHFIGITIFNIMLVVKKDALLKLTVYDNWDILYCKQHISDLFTARDKNRPICQWDIKIKSLVTSYARYYTSNKSIFKIYMGIIEIIFNLM